MKEELIININFKIAITLNKLLEGVKSMSKKQHKEGEFANSYNTIALQAGLRKATVSDALNGKSLPSILTIILIIEAMGYDFTHFAEMYDSITDKEIINFKKLQAS